jgi:hypothetical protein
MGTCIILEYSTPTSITTGPTDSPVESAKTNLTLLLVGARLSETFAEIALSYHYPLLDSDSPKLSPSGPLV